MGDYDMRPNDCDVGDTVDVPMIHATYEYEHGGILGDTLAPVKRVESYELITGEITYNVIIDEWPIENKRKVEMLEKEREEFIGLFQELYNSLGDQMYDFHREKIKDLLEDYWRRKSEVL